MKTELISKSIYLIILLFCTAPLISIAPMVHAQDTNQGTDIFVGTVPDSSLSQAVFERTQSSWPWYTTRASGLIAGLLLVLLVMSGAGFITGHTFSFLEPITAWATHRALGIAFTIAVFVHVGALYFDHFVNFDLVSLLVPFASDFRPIEILGFPVGSLYVALGIFAMYILFAIVLTSLVLIDRKPKTWKAFHVLSYIAMVLVFIHALYLGTDLAQGVLRYVWISMGVFVLIATMARVWRIYTT